VPVGVLVVELTVSVDEPDIVTVLGLTVAVSPDGAVVVNVTVPLNPPTAVMVIVDVPEPPCVMVMLDGLALIVKSDTLKVTVVLRDSAPLVPVTVTV
jgi:uncharacterized secreted protein with C-terminal beta-propeller domain